MPDDEEDMDLEDIKDEADFEIPATPPKTTKPAPAKERKDEEIVEPDDWRVRTVPKEEGGRLDPTEMMAHITKYVDDTFHKYLRQVSKGYVEVDVKDLTERDLALADSLLDNFSETLRGFELMVNEKFSEKKDSLQKEIEVHFVNLPECCSYQIYQLRFILLEKLVKVRAVIRSTSEVFSRVTSIKTECKACGALRSVLQFGKKPTKARCGCGASASQQYVLSKSTIDCQLLDVEEVPEKMKNIQQTMQRVPAVVEGSLTDPIFSDRLQPGNRIEIIGSLVEKPKYLLPKDEQEGTNIITLVLKVNNIIVLEKDYEEVELSETDEKAIKDLSQDNKLFDKITASIAPGLYGLDDIKLVLGMQAVEGVSKEREDGTFTKGKIHVLMVGDPATGKSQLCEVMYKNAPKARYAVGGASSRAGITAGAVKDETSKQWVLEAGAMVLSHNGLFCLDEADKMSPEDSASLHEGMAQGTITKTVAGVNARLPASCSVLAAANPKNSRFDPTTPLGAQITMPVSLLSRFDVIFPLFDTPGEKDQSLASHIVEGHINPKKQEPPISAEMLRKYFAYAKKQKPKLTKEAGQELVDFYTKLRKNAITGDKEIKAIPITPRQLEALIRLSEASAKLRLSTSVTNEDTARARKIFLSFMERAGMAADAFDVDNIFSSVAASQRQHYKIVLEIFLEEEKNAPNGLVEDGIIYTKCMDKGMTENTVNDALERLRVEGSIYQPVRGKWKKI